MTKALSLIGVCHCESPLFPTLTPGISMQQNRCDPVKNGSMTLQRTICEVLRHMNPFNLKYSL